MAVITQNERLEAVMSKLESVENELRQIKRICQYIRQQEDSPSISSVPLVDDRKGLWPGQLDYQITDKPTNRKQNETSELCIE